MSVRVCGVRLRNRSRREFHLPVCRVLCRKGIFLIFSLFPVLRGAKRCKSFHRASQPVGWVPATAKAGAGEGYTGGIFFALWETFRKHGGSQSFAVVRAILDLLKCVLIFDGEPSYVRPEQKSSHCVIAWRASQCAQKVGEIVALRY